MNVAAGLAMEAPIGEAELAQVEDFYTRRGAPPVLATCAFADPTLFRPAGQKGLAGDRVRERAGAGIDWAVSLPQTGVAGDPSAAGAARAVAPAPPPAVKVRVCAGAQRDLWGHMAALGFSDEAEPRPAQEEFGSIMAARADAILVLAWVDGKPAGTGALVIDDRVGWLSGDSTLPQYRRRGIQQAIQRHRLQLAHEAGCTLAVTESAPGSGSQRNMERLGFRVIYTHLEFAKV